jgi:CheY-like chemotaxis protein
MAKTLLLADDSVTIQKVVGIAFASEDIDLVTVDNGDDAVARAKEVRPDAVLADVVMPGMNGYEVCEALKADPSLQHVPVLLLTGTFEAFDDERARAAGAAGHVAKPFEAQVLVERVREILAAAPVAAPTLASDPSNALTPPVASASAGESFDFFDDDLGDLSPQQGESASLATSAARDRPAGLQEPDLDDSDLAFAFADDDLSSAPPDPRVTPTPPPSAMAAAAPDSTVAIMPDDPDPIAPSSSRIDTSMRLPEADGDDLLSADLGAASIESNRGAADAFDFEIDDSPSTRDAGLVSAEDLAAASVLDPKRASGFDVSYSDLSAAAPVLAPPEPPPLDSAQGQAPEAEASSLDSLLPPIPEAAPVFERVATPEPPRAAPPAPLEGAETPTPTADPPRVEIGERPYGVERAGDAPDHFGDFATPAPRVPTSEADSLFDALPEPFSVAEAEAETSFDEAFSAAPLAGPAEFAEPVSDLRTPASGTHDPSALAGIALAEVTPQLREQLHDTLEKIAWESFGAVAEQIVRQAVERAEQIAWEVIPPMAETLIREEIRRMKGESED